MGKDFNQSTFGIHMHSNFIVNDPDDPISFYVFQLEGFINILLKPSRYSHYIIKYIIDRYLSTENQNFQSKEDDGNDLAERPYFRFQKLINFPEDNE